MEVRDRVSPTCRDFRRFAARRTAHGPLICYLLDGDLDTHATRCRGP